MQKQVFTESANAQLDQLLEDVSWALQITETQFKKAEGRYKAVEEWLCAAKSPVAGFTPGLYPQGSMRLRTTVKPRRDSKDQDEFDLDIVCELQEETESLSSADAYALVRDRLLAHETYAAMLEEKRRCLCLNYKGEFHMDILPAKPDPVRGGDAVLVPDKKLGCWRESNPRGYAEWFDGRAAEAFVEARRDAEPLPSDEPGKSKATLRRVVQLLKRCRDMRFDDPELAPRSIVLTTLCARHYRGELLCADALLTIVRAIRSWSENEPGVPVVLNPTNDAENFAEAWDVDSYGRFKEFIVDLHGLLERLTRARSLANVQQVLAEMFGEKISAAGTKRFTERVEAARQKDNLHTTAKAATLTTAASQSRKIPKSTFYGDETRSG